MKPRILVCKTAITLFAALGILLSVAAQEGTAQEKENNARHHHYKLIDMGTLGGPTSSINYPAFGANLNRQGMTVGWSATDSPTVLTSNPLVCGGIDGVIPFITHAFEWNGAVMDLGALPARDNNCSEPFGINGKGEIVGASEGDEIDLTFGVKGAHAVLWKGGEITDLGSLGGNEAAAFGINNREQIIGNSTNTISDPFCFFATVQNRAFLWERGQMQDLGTLGGNCAGVGGLNERGQIVGGSTTSAVANPVTGFPPQDPFLWEKGKGMTDLGTLGGAFGGAGAINNQGQIIGQSSIATDPGACNGFPDNNDLNCHAFLWEQGRLIDLTTSTVGGSPVGVAGINDAGEIIGWGVFPNAPLKEEAFFWRKGIATDLGTLGNCYAVAHSINSKSQVVGLAYSFAPGLPGFPCGSNDARAFLWEKGSTVDLNTLIPPGSPLELSDAMDINDRGEIDGIGVPPGVPSINFVTQGHGFLLIPCDENHPNLEGCDYSLTDGSARTNVASTQRPQNQIPTPDVVKGLLRASGPRATSWFHGIGAQLVK